MEGDLYLIIRTPNSGDEKVLSLDCSTKIRENKAHFACFPRVPPTSKLPFLTWFMQDDEIQIENPSQLAANEWFLFLCNEFDLADQIEASIALLNENPQLKLCRVISLIDSHLHWSRIISMPGSMG